MDVNCSVLSLMLMYASTFVWFFLGWFGFRFCCLGFFFFVRFVGEFFICFVVGLFCFVLFFIWPNSVQKRVFFMPGNNKLPATSAYMLSCYTSYINQEIFS